MEIPVFYAYGEELLTEFEALELIERHLGRSCGDIMIDLEYLRALENVKEFDN